MSLESAIEGGFWNVAGAFNSVFNVSTASSWYAMQSATNWNSGNVFAAVGQDIAGGYIGMVTGITSSPAQQWWASGGSVALSFVTGGASTAAQIVMAAPVASLATQMAVQAQPVSLINSLQLLTGAMGTGLGVAANVFKPIIPTVFTTQSLNTFVFSMGVNTLNHIWGIGGNIGSAIDAVGASYAAGIEHGTISPQVGGVLFDKCASVATSIGELTAAYWDEPTKSLVLLGRSDGQGGRVSIPLPKMDRQLLFAALRAVLSNQALGVSIDPPAEHRHGGKNGKCSRTGILL